MKRVSQRSAANRLPILLEEVRACTLCVEHLPLGPRPIVQMESQARILIVGQAPGRKVHASGVPFDDASGERLRQWMGIDRPQFYDPKLVAILPMGFCYPGTGRSGDLPPRPECAPQWRSRLLAELKNVQLTLVIGQHVLAWHLPDRTSDNLTETVKDWETSWPDVVPMPHPSPRNNRWLKANPWFVDDLVPQLQKRVKTLLAK